MKPRLLITIVLLVISAALIYALNIPTARLGCSISSVEPWGVTFCISNPSAKAYLIQAFVQTFQGGSWQPEKLTDSGAWQSAEPGSFSMISVPKPRGVVTWRAVFHCERSLTGLEKGLLALEFRLGLKPSWFARTLISDVIQ
jgi:hypothetical protein